MKITYPSAEYAEQIINYSTKVDVKDQLKLEMDGVLELLDKHGCKGFSFEYGFLCGLRWYFDTNDIEYIYLIDDVLCIAEQIAKDDIIHDEYHERVLFDRRHRGSWDYGFFVGVEYAMANKDDREHFYEKVP